MAYPSIGFNYSTRRQPRDQVQAYQTIGGNLLRVDTAVVEGEVYDVEHIATWDQCSQLIEHYDANHETTFNITLDGDVVSVRYLSPPQIVSKSGAWYRITTELGRVL